MQKPSKRKNVGKYASQLKIAVAREYLTSDLGYKGLGIKYGISKSSVCDFVKWYREKYGDGIVEGPVAVGVDKTPMEEADLKITALEMLIANASKELGVDLVKKFGTKQPKK